MNRHRSRHPQRRTARRLGLGFVGIGHGDKAARLAALGADVFRDFHDLQARGWRLFAA